MPRATSSAATATSTPATPGQGLLWDTSTLATDGTLRVVANPDGIVLTEIGQTGNAAPVYDLSGRRVVRNAMQPRGVYVTKGKKAYLQK